MAKNYWTKHRNTGTTARCEDCRFILDTIAENNLIPIISGEFAIGPITEAMSAIIGSWYIDHWRFNVTNIVGAHYEANGGVIPAAKQEKPMPVTLKRFFANEEIIDVKMLRQVTEEIQDIVVPANQQRKASDNMIIRMVDSARDAYHADNDKLAWHLLKEASIRYRAAKA